MNAVLATPPTQPASSSADVQRTRIAIVAHFAYGAFAGGATGHVGGVEWQTSLTARWLAARGHDVSLLTWNEGQPDDVTIDGVRVLSICRRDAGLPGLRFVFPRWTGLLRAMRRADADVYYHNCAEYVTGQIALWCRRNGRGFVFSAASNMDCDPRLPEMRKLRERWLYRAGLRRADRLIVQTRAQQESLRNGFGLAAQVIPMPCPGPADFRPPAASAALAAPRVVWIGRLIPLKRVEWLLDIAERLPHVNFDVIAPPDREDAYAAPLRERAATLSNVVWHGRVERARMADFYGRAALLCCTSTVEGFPNTFLEAWSHGVPVVTTFDPDGIVAARGLGAVGKTPDSLATAMRDLLENPASWSAASNAGRMYYAGHHAPDVVLPQFEQVFMEVGAAAAARRAVSR